jgi:SAM-dependent methyltransferase
VSAGLTVVVTGLERVPAPGEFLAQVRDAAAALTPDAEILSADTAAQPFGAALRAAFDRASAPYIITVDTDVSGPLTFLADLWARRDAAEIVVASRYLPESDAVMPPLRARGSAVLNVAFRRGLSLGIRDGSSALRLQAVDYDVLQEVLVRAYAAGWRVAEIPLTYRPRPGIKGKVHGRLARAYLRTFRDLWRLRNSIAAADYDYRAHDSVIPLQRYWQRTRYRHITGLIAAQGAVLDVGCGSSHIIGALPRGSVALDVLANKLRFARRFAVPRVRASGFALPFADDSFPCVLCSQVIEHVPMVPSMIDELCRVLRPGGRLVLGTPDYDRWEWVWTEKAYGFCAPRGYADEHISHYTRRGLLDDFRRRGYAHEATRYVLRGELILAFRKPATVP